MSTSSSTQDSPPFHWHYTELDDRNFQIRGRVLFFTIVLFAVVLLFTFLFLYARWVCRLETRPRATSSLPHAPPPFLTVETGLDQSVIDTIPVILHQSKGGDCAAAASASECSICLGEFDDGDKVKVLPKCRHCFHCECVDKWLRTRSSCPLCRNSLRVDSVVIAVVPSS